MTKPKDKFRRMNAVKLNEVSVVDSPMQEPATVAILKRSDVDKRLAVTTPVAGHAHSLVTGNYDGAELRLGRTSYATDANGRDHAHDWITDEAGNIIIVDAAGHSHGLAVLTKNNPAGGRPAATGGMQSAGNNPADTVGKSQEDHTMTPEELKKAAEDAAAKVQELEKETQRLQSINALTAEHRAHFDTLKGADADAFLAKTVQGRDEILKNLRDADPVVYTRTDGTAIRKSAGDLVLSLAKQADDQAKELAETRKAAQDADLQKRASDLLKNSAGTPAVKGALLGAVESIKDETLRQGALAILTAKDAGLGKAFETLGTTAAPATGDSSSAEAQLDAMAKKYAADNKVSYEVAYAKVCETSEGVQLYKRHREERAAR